MPMLSINDTELHVEDRGHGQPVVFLHGWGTSGRVWDGQVVALVADHRTVTVDWRGCGRSAQPAGGMTIAQIVADVAAVLATLELDRPVLVGSSIGATFAVELALRTPVPLAGIVAVDAPGHWATQGMADKLAELRTALRRDRARALTAWVTNWYGPAVGVELRDWTVRQILDASPFVDDLLTEHAAYDWRPDLPALTLPVTVVHGRLDAEIPVAVAEEAAALVPRGDLVVIDGAGHLPHQEQPDAFNATLRATIANLAQEAVDAQR